MIDLNKIYKALITKYLKAIVLDPLNKEKIYSDLIQEMLCTLKTYEVPSNINENDSTNTTKLDLDQCEDTLVYLSLLHASKKLDFSLIIVQLKKYLSPQQIENVQKKFKQQKVILDLLAETTDVRDVELRDDILLLAYCFRYGMTYINQHPEHLKRCLHDPKAIEFLNFRSQLEISDLERQDVLTLKLMLGNEAASAQDIVHLLLRANSLNLLTFYIEHQIFNAQELLKVQVPLILQKGEETKLPLIAYLIHYCARHKEVTTTLFALIDHYPQFFNIYFIDWVVTFRSHFSTEDFHHLMSQIMKRLPALAHNTVYCHLMQICIINLQSIEFVTLLIKQQKIDEAKFIVTPDSSLNLPPASILPTAVACLNQQHDMLQCLHAHGFSIDLKPETNGPGYASTLICALIWGCDESIEYLLQQNVNLDDLHYAHPLVLAAKRKTPVALQALITKLENSTLLIKYLNFPDFFKLFATAISQNKHKEIQNHRVPLYEKLLTTLVNPALLEVKNLAEYLIQLPNLIRHDSRKMISITALLKPCFDLDVSTQGLPLITVHFYMNHVLHLLERKKTNMEGHNSNTSITHNISNYFKAAPNEQNVATTLSTTKFYVDDMPLQQSTSMETLCFILKFNWNSTGNWLIANREVHPFFVCCLFNNRPILEAMIQKHLAIPAYALGYCVKEKLEQAIDVLLEQNVDICARNDYGYSPLDFAVLNNDVATVQKLLKKLFEQTDKSSANQHIYCACNLFDQKTLPDIKQLLCESLPQEAKEKIGIKVKKNNPYNIELKPLKIDPIYKFFTFMDNNKTYTARILIDDWNKINKSTNDEVNTILKDYQQFGFFGPKIKKIKEGIYKVRPNSNFRLWLEAVPGEENLLEGHIAKHKR